VRVHVADFGEAHADAGNPVTDFEIAHMLADGNDLPDALVPGPGWPIDALFEHVDIPRADTACERADLNFIRFWIGDRGLDDFDAALWQVTIRSALHVVPILRDAS